MKGYKNNESISNTLHQYVDTPINTQAAFEKPLIGPRTVVPDLPSQINATTKDKPLVGERNYIPETHMASGGFTAAKPLVGDRKNMDLHLEGKQSLHENGFRNSGLLTGHTKTASLGVGTETSQPANLLDKVA